MPTLLSTISSSSLTLTSLKAVDDTSTTSLYPVMVATTQNNEVIKTSTSKLKFNASTGTLEATVFNSTSDESLKTNIEKIENACNILQQIEGVSFVWKNDNTKSYGVIAQQIEKTIPEIVTTSNGIKSVNYDALIPFLIEANKELLKRVEELENKLK